MDRILDFVISGWAVLAQMAPYLLFGFLMSGVLYIFISPEWVERHLGGKGFWPILKSSLFGVPLPLCSCGVIPVTASLYKHGASRAATTSFLLSTPTTGVDSILATYALLGPVYAVFRPVVALVSGIMGGGLVAIFDKDERSSETHETQEHCTDSCCTEKGKSNTLGRALRFAFLTLPKDIAKPLLVGIAAAALIGTVVQENYLSAYLGGGLLSMFIMMAIGIPLYVCATASIPLAVGFMYMGASPGAALVFLIAGPATNAATIAVVWKLLGRRTALIYLFTVAVTALAAGLVLDATFANLGISGLSHMGHNHEHGVGWFGHASAVVLLAVLGVSLFWKEKMALLHEEDGAVKTDEGTETVRLKVRGMTCTHCVSAVTGALRQTSGVGNAHVDLDGGEATVSGTGLDADTLAQSIRDLGYEVTVLSTH